MNKKLEEILEQGATPFTKESIMEMLEKAFVAGRFCQLCKKTDDNVGYACVRCFQESNKQAEQKGRQEVLTRWDYCGCPVCFVNACDFAGFNWKDFPHLQRERPPAHDECGRQRGRQEVFDRWPCTGVVFAEKKCVDTECLRCRWKDSLCEPKANEQTKKKNSG